MSLITLSSKRNTEIQRDVDPAIIRNHFKDGIVLREGTEVALVSLTINKLDLYEVIAGENDTLVWRIGSRAQFEQHTVTITEGNYNGDDLATEIALQINNSTLLGNYKGQWTCVYDQTAQKGEGSFTIDYGQNETPAAPNKQTYTTYEGGTPTISNNGTDTVAVSGSLNGQVDDFATDDNPLIITGNKGIFPNEGMFQTVVRPQEGYTQLDQTTALQAGGGLVDETVYSVGVPTNRLGTFNNTTGTPATNGWTLEFAYDNGDPSIYWVYLGDGEWGIDDGGGGALTATRANSDEFYFWNPTRGVWADALNGGRGAEVANNGSFYIISGGVPFTVPQGNVGMGMTRMGYVRNYLYTGRTNYPGDANADILKSTPDGFDITMTVEDNADLDGVLISLGRMVQQQGVEFPNPNWRNGSAMVFETLDPETELNSLPAISGVTPTNWAAYTYPTDHIRMRVEIDNITRVNVHIAHDTSGDGVFIEEQFIRRTGDNNGFNTTIKEKFFPLRPCIAVSRGNQYFPSRYILDGKFDETEIVNPNFQVANANTVLHKGETVEFADESETSLEVANAVPANALSLSALYKLGDIFASDTAGTPPSGGLPLLDHQPTGTINTLLGLSRFYNFASGSTSNSITSSSEPITTIREPTLSLELPDFNIKGANGTTGDSMRVIAIIPKEELGTNEKTGTLHYYPTFPVFIDLNLPQESIFYDLNAILRLPNGRVANDLINPTEITLLFKESEETKQRRMMKEQASIMSSMIGNIQSAKIAGIGVGNPLL